MTTLCVILLFVAIIQYGIICDKCKDKEALYQQLDSAFEEIERLNKECGHLRRLEDMRKEVRQK